MEEERSNLMKAFRLVLVGWATSGKSASGNTILGRDEFISGRRSSRCVSQHAVVAGRELTVVDTPGWTDLSLDDTPESIQKEIISSGVPAPDAVLLLIPLHMEITEGYIHSVTEHLSLLGDTVWSRTIVLFTFGKCLQNQTIEGHIEGNTALQYLIRLCGNNYHIFENAKGPNDKQVEDLLFKMEKMSLDNNLNKQQIEDPEAINYLSQKTETKNTVIQSSELESEKPEKPRSGGTQCFPELRIVLLGLEKSGKSSTGNTILGSARFGEWTAKYQKEEAEVAGRRLVVIDTPPWQMDSGISPDQNIVNWVCQCPPGPHALIFVQNLSSKFALTQWRIVQRYIELLGEQAWEHVIVIFTGADIIEGMNMKSYIDKKDAGLQMLLAKCGNRHHFFNNRRRSYSTQVTDLLEGIEKMSSQHSPGFYEVDQTVASSMEEINQCLFERVQKGCLTVAAKEHAQHDIFHKGKAHRLTEVRIVLLGEKWSGKTTAAKTMANLYFKEEKTKSVAATTTIDERTVQIVDTPGWSIRNWGQSSHKQEKITEALSLCHPGPHAFLIVVNMTSSFTEKQRVVLERNLACLSNKVWKHAMVLFTFGETLQGGLSLENLMRYIENEGENLKWLVKKCHNRFHVFSNTPFNDFPQVRELLEGIDEMVEANSGQYFSSIRNNETLSSERKSHLMDTDDDDLEYTPRERMMMEKMMMEIRELLMLDIKSCVNEYMKAARSLPLIKPDMSLEQPASEDSITERQKGTRHQEEESSAYVSESDVDKENV